MRAQLRARAARLAGRRPSRIHYLVAPAGLPNYGDELIARAWLDHLARTCPGDEVVLDCHSPGQATLLLRGAHPRLTVVDTLWRMMPLAHENHRPGAVWEWSAHAAAHLGAEPRLDEGVALLHRADSIHLLGGGYLNGVWPDHIALVTAVAAVARRLGIPAAATGQGLLPAAEGEAGAALVEAAAAFALFDTRDDASFDVIAGAPGASRGGDDAWLAVGGARPLGEDAAVEGDGGVVLCLQSDLTGRFTAGGRAGAEALAHWTGRVLDAWEVDPREVTVVEGIPGKDRVVYEMLGERLAGARFVPFRELWHRGMPLEPRRTWISTRFHPHLVAAAAGCPGVAVATEPGYYDVKHGSLVAAGSRWTLQHEGETIPARPTAGGFSAADRAAAVAAKQELAERLYS